ncbi:MAG TPA: hypothetical protein PLA77_09560, partial [Bacteroidales bacterium]|nr:hypothetical protein [Bacteroidales bacterium]
MVYRITQVISSEANVNMKELKFETRDGVFTGSIGLFVHDTSDLEQLITKIIRIKGVKQVVRIEENEAGA